MREKDRIQELRDEYEAALDEADKRRAEYHRAIKKLHMTGVPLREIAEGLGISYQRVHQIVQGEPGGRRSRKRKIAGLGLAIALILGNDAIVRLSSVSTGSRIELGTGVTPVPSVVGLPLTLAGSQMNAKGLCLSDVASDSSSALRGVVTAQSPAPNVLVSTGSIVSLTVGTRGVLAVTTAYASGPAADEVIIIPKTRGVHCPNLRIFGKSIPETQ